MRGAGRVVVHWDTASEKTFSGLRLYFGPKGIFLGLRLVFWVEGFVSLQG
jgi:hypothetical protein